MVIYRWRLQDHIHSPPKICWARIILEYALGGIAKLGTTLLGVEVLVSAAGLARRTRPLPYQAIPLISPGHDVVAQEHGGCPVEDLFAEPPPCVENSVVGSSGKGVLAVGADAVGDDAPLRPR